MSEAGPSSNNSEPVKLGQRLVKSCNICHRRKVRCDRQIPCSRCVARGIAELCKPEARRVRGKANVESAPKPTTNPSYIELQEENKALLRKLAALQSVIDSTKLSPASQLTSSHGPTEEPQVDGVSMSEGRSLEITGDAASETLDDVTDDGHLEILSSLAQLRGIIDWQPPTASSTPRNDDMLKQTLAIIEPAASTRLVEFHVTGLLWLHCSFHGPSFLETHQTWRLERELRVPAEKSYDFLALYFAVISSSLFFMDVEEAVQLGYAPAAIPILCKLLVGTAFHCLQNSDFMSNPTIQSLQAICIMSMVGHHHGHTTYLASLYHSAIEHCMRLGFHHLPRGSCPHDYLRAELGRRIWTCLCLWESLDVGKFNSTALIYPTSDTLPPTNVGDDELSPQHECKGHPLNQTLQPTHLIAIGRLGQLSRDMYFALRTKQGIKARYQCMKQFDHKLTHLLDEFPDLQPREDEPSLTSAQFRAHLPDYRPWSRHTWSTVISSTRIVLYKPYLGLAYSKGGEWMEAREICLSAAQTLIRYRRRPVPTIFTKPWHVSSDTILAGAVIASELVHGGHPPNVKSVLLQEVTDCLEMVSTRGPSTAITDRGVALLSMMLRREQDAEARRARHAAVLLEQETAVTGFTGPTTDFQPILEGDFSASQFSDQLGMRLDMNDFLTTSWLDEVLGVGANYPFLMPT